MTWRWRSGCGREAVAAHCGAERGQVGRAVGGACEDRSDLVEEVGAEDAGVMIASAFAALLWGVAVVADEPVLTVAGDRDVSLDFVRPLLRQVDLR